MTLNHVRAARAAVAIMAGVAAVCAPISTSFAQEHHWHRVHRETYHHHRPADHNPARRVGGYVKTGARTMGRNVAIGAHSVAHNVGHVGRAIGGGIQHFDRTVGGALAGHHHHS